MAAENFIVSARKYRPEAWDAVVGQESITSTLKNAIATNQLSQAYLFCGPRGVGKTTCARIFAKSINTGEDEDLKDFSYNIFELDAASNNHVEDIRSLIDQVRIPPQTGKYKVYIIDEVHMLSLGAFNAFLKTLEEPPAHAIFILATTEKHKVIPTILSRCQIFDFNRIQIKDIANHLAHIAEQEGVETEPDALTIIAQKADGALRDALSIFDQIIAFSGKKITYESVIENLNVLDYDYYFKLVDQILEEDISGSLLTFNEILNNGFDGHHFITGLGEHLRNLMVSKNASTVTLMDVGDGIREKYLDQSQRCGIHFLVKAIDIANQADLDYRPSKNPRLLVELALMQMCSIPYNEGQKKKSDLRLIPLDLPKSLRPSVRKPQKTVSNPALNPADRVSRVAEKPMGKSKYQGVKRNVDSFSIKEKLAPVKEEQVDNEQEEGEMRQDLPRDPFSQEQLKAAWKKYAVETDHEKMSIEALFKLEPSKRDEQMIDLKLQNNTQVDYLNEVRGEVLVFLKKELNNFYIELNAKVELSNEKGGYMSDKDIYDSMLKKNPLLDELRRKLKLDLDT
ncbi:DNA polymerase III subunit gamma/tau [Halocola ammonii]